jgi:hypothetical protein
MRLLQAAYKQRLRAIVAAVPDWVAEEILSASEHVGEDRDARPLPFIRYSRANPCRKA